jgi:FtsP/CotA-like multicopper oxidase with cupredoxin domain
MKDRLITAAITLVMIGGFAFLGFLGWQWWQSRLPARYDVMDYGVVDRGGGPEAQHVHFSVADTKGPATGRPDVALTLTAAPREVSLASGTKVDAWAFNGLIPGPQIRIARGQLLQVTLVNNDISDGVTIHWHGLDVPNAEDGVAGVTQDAVQPGARHVYRFRPEQVGTF